MQPEIVTLAVPDDERVGLGPDFVNQFIRKFETEETGYG